MRIYFRASDTSEDVEATMPHEGADHVEAERGAECPRCGSGRREGERFELRGIASTQTTDDEGVIHAEAGCLACFHTVGALRVEPSTIFGVEEDREVLVHGRARVYGGAIR